MKNLIAISGNIGIGKTTLSKKLADHLGWQTNLEGSKNNPYLEDFYKNMRKWAFHSQMHFLVNSIKKYYELLKSEESIVQDRTFYENAEIFATNLHNRGLLNDRDWELYQMIYQSFYKLFPAPDLIIYLRASEDSIYKRINQREGQFRKKISRKYITELNGLFDSWVENFKLSPILIVNYDDLDFKNSQVDFQSFLDSIKDYIKK